MSPEQWLAMFLLYGVFAIWGEGERKRKLAEIRATGTFTDSWIPYVILCVLSLGILFI
jgi:hypothetical protein